MGATTSLRTEVVDGHQTSEETTMELYHAPLG
jgi:hypothetical protein